MASPPTTTTTSSASTTSRGFDSYPQLSTIDPYRTAAPSSLSPAASSAASSSSPSTSDPDNNDNKSDRSLYQYYFAFIALIVIVAIICSWLIFRRKRSHIRRLRASRQHALSRDLEGANVNRGWTYGDWRLREAMTMTPWRRREEEGLNEAGEAPPPYKPRSDNDAAVLEPAGNAAAAPDNQEPAVPPPALGRDQVGLKPPDYFETIARPVDPDDVGSGPSLSTSAGAAATAAGGRASPATAPSTTNAAPNPSETTRDDALRHE